MSQPSQVSPERPGDAINYRPLSGLAIASLVCGSLYAALVVVCALVAMVQGSPVFLSSWLLLLPAAGVGLALLAQWRIRTAEGTLAGAGVARWGLWLSVLTGLGYGTYDTFTGIAVKQQANRFLTEMGDGSGFFPRLEKGDLSSAFLLTRPPLMRGNVNPDDNATMARLFDEPQAGEAVGPLTEFRHNEVVDAVQQAGKEGKAVEPMGVRDCTYAQKGYKVVRNYRVSNREVTMDIAVTTQSTESEQPGEGRKWFVVWKRDETHTLPSTALTPLGINVRKLRQSSINYFYDWYNKLGKGQVDAVAKALKLPDLGDVPAPPPADQAQATVRDYLERLLQGKLSDPSQVIFKVTARPYGPWSRTEDGKLRMSHPFTVQVPAGVGQSTYIVQGDVVVESVAPVDPETFNGNAEWRVAALNIERIRLSLRKPL